MGKQIHFSVDDTLGCFIWLNRNRKTVKNIFDSTTFGFSKYMHEKYGVATSFYCMYTDGNNMLNDVSVEFSEQFQKNKEWMKFGFHCYDSMSDYSVVSYEKIKSDYEKVVHELKRITGGGQCLTDTIRLHFFAGNDTVINCLKNNGINQLLCADDDRGSYNLSIEQEKLLKKNGTLCDSHTHMNYLTTDVRLEKVNDIKAEINKINQQGRDCVIIFTHEKYLKELEIKNRLEIFLKEFS